MTNTTHNNEATEGQQSLGITMESAAAVMAAAPLFNLLAGYFRPQLATCEGCGCLCEPAEGERYCDGCHNGMRAAFDQMAAEWDAEQERADDLRDLAAVEEWEEREANAGACLGWL